jgi:hypothetical protein
LTPVRCVAKNGSVVRNAVAVALSLALQAAALSAPLVHAHPDDHATDHHGGRTVHTHWAGHGHSHRAPDTPFIDHADDDRAIFLNAFVAVAAEPVAAPVVAPLIFELAVPAERAAHQVVDIAPGHDPPGAASLPSRAPPARLS